MSCGARAKRVRARLSLAERVARLASGDRVAGCLGSLGEVSCVPPGRQRRRSLVPAKIPDSSRICIYDFKITVYYGFFIHKNVLSEQISKHDLVRNFQNGRAARGCLLFTWSL
jgi:hypothetical protein